MRTLLLPVLLIACSGKSADTADTGGAPASDSTDWSAPGPHTPGTVSRAITVEGRDVPVQVWYPAVGSADVTDLHLLVADETDRATLAGLLADAPAGCPATRNAAALDATPAELEPAPLVALSHCHTCLGVSNGTVAAHLASHGFVVVAPDHVGNTLFDLQAGDGGTLDEATLALRAADIQGALDEALGGTLLPAGVAVDPDAVGVGGHSFGSVTAGRVLDIDPRVRSALAIAAPVDNPLLQGADAAALDKPVMMVLLEEDNSIGAIGNTVIETNYAELGGPGWLVRVPDAGHWTVSDLCGVVDSFLPGCGDADRQTDGTPFTYAPPDDGRATAAALAAAFFAHTLRDDAAAGTWLAAPDTALPVTVETR
jgi:predicted dienelactone hydrolase